MIMGIPDAVHIQAAPGYGLVQPSTIPSGAWVELRGYVEKMEITRGTNHELQLPESGTLTLTLNNQTGVLTPNGAGWTSPSSLFPNGAQKCPIRVYYVEAGVTYNRYFGFISEYGNDNHSNEEWSKVQILAHDALAVCQASNMWASHLGQQYMAYGATYWYTCNDANGTRQANQSLTSYTALDNSGAGNNGTYGNITGVTLNPTAGANPDPSYDAAANTLTCHPVGIPIIQSGTYTHTQLFYLDDGAYTTDANGNAVLGTPTIQTALPLLLAACSTGLAGWSICEVYNATVNQWYLQFKCYSATGALIGTITGTTPIAREVKQAAGLGVSGGVATLYLDGVSQGTCSMTGASTPAAPIVVMGTTGPGTGVPYAPHYGGCGDIALFSANLAGTTHAFFWGFCYPIARTSGEWINKALDNAGPACADRIIDAGLTTLIEPDAGTADSQKVRQMLEQITLDECGQLWVDPTGHVVFRNRLWTATYPNNSVQCTLGSSTGNTAYTGGKLLNSDIDLWTAASAERVNGSPIVVVAPTATTVSGRTGGFGKRTFAYPQTLNVLTDAEVTSLVTWIGSKYCYEQTRVSPITVTPWVPPVGSYTGNTMAAVLPLDLWSTVEFSTINGPGQSVSFGAAQLIQGIKDTINFTEQPELVIQIQSTPAWNTVVYWQPGVNSPFLYPIAA